jgi:hypothetical protein
MACRNFELNVEIGSGSKDRGRGARGQLVQCVGDLTEPGAQDSGTEMIGRNGQWIALREGSHNLSLEFDRQISGRSGYHRVGMKFGVLPIEDRLA